MPLRGSLRRALLAGSALCLVSPSLAQEEGGVRMIFGLEQRLEAGRNIGLEVPDEGDSLIATTRLSFGLSSRTPIDSLEFNASTALIIEDSPDTDGTEAELGRPDLRFAYVREIPDEVLALTARFRQDDVDAFDDDLGEDDEEGTRTDYGATARYEFGRTTPLAFAIEASYDVTEYEDTTDPDLNDTEEVSLGLETRLRLNEVLAATARLGLSREEEDDAAETVTERVTASVGLDYAVSPRLDVSASLGVTEIETEEFGITERTTGPVARFGFQLDMPNGSATGDLVVTTDEDEGERATLTFGRALDLPDGSLTARLGVTSADDAGTDIIGGVNWVRELPDGRIDVGLARSVTYDDDDDETDVRTVLDIGWARELNAVSAIALDFSYEISDAPSERIEQAEIGATYRYELTPDWNLDSGVRYRVRDDNDGRAESPSVFVALGRSFEIRP